MRKLGLAVIAVLTAGGGIYALIGWGMGADTSPLTRFFLTFFGALIVLQILPAALLFGCMIKAMFKVEEEIVEQVVLVEGQGGNNAG